MITLKINSDTGNELLRECKQYDLFGNIKDRHALILLTEGQQRILYRLGQYLLSVYTAQRKSHRNFSLRLDSGESEFLLLVFNEIGRNITRKPYLASLLNQFITKYDKHYGQTESFKIHSEKVFTHA